MQNMQKDFQQYAQQRTTTTNESAIEGLKFRFNKFTLSIIIVKVKCSYARKIKRRRSSTIAFGEKGIAAAMRVSAERIGEE